MRSHCSSALQTRPLALRRTLTGNGSGICVCHCCGHARVSFKQRGCGRLKLRLSTSQAQAKRSDQPEEDTRRNLIIRYYVVVQLEYPGGTSTTGTSGATGGPELSLHFNRDTRHSPLRLSAWSTGVNTWGRNNATIACGPYQPLGAEGIRVPATSVCSSRGAFSKRAGLERSVGRASIPHLATSNRVGSSRKEGANCFRRYRWQWPR